MVAKALNTVSGYFLEQVAEQGVRPVPIASDSASAKVGKKYTNNTQTFICLPNAGNGCHPLNLSWSQSYGHGWA